MDLAIRTDHQVVAFDADRMALFDNTTGLTVVTATRTAGVWLVHADGVDDTTTGDRAAAITAMTEHALAALPGAGYSTTVPHGLADLP